MTRDCASRPWSVTSLNGDPNSGYFLHSHDRHIEEVIERAKGRKYTTIPLWLNFSYGDTVNREQFERNMQHFRQTRDPKTGFYPNNNTFCKFAESCVFIGGARAALLQLAHPMVAISVKRHSYIIRHSTASDAHSDNQDIVDCDLSSLSKALKMRFHRTFAIMFPIIFGPLDCSINAATKAWTMHQHIEGHIGECIGNGDTFDVDTYYSANMVVPLRWVWATLVEGTVFMNLLFGNIQTADSSVIEEMYTLSKNTALAFGLRQDQLPLTYSEFEEYYHYHMMQSEHIVVCRDCGNWCRVFFMANQWCMKPVILAMECLTAMMLPRAVRDKFNRYDAGLLYVNIWRYWYGLFWLGLSRAIYSLLPRSVRYLNHFSDLQKRMGHGTDNALCDCLRNISKHAANKIVEIFLEG